MSFAKKWSESEWFYIENGCMQSCRVTHICVFPEPVCAISNHKYFFSAKINLFGAPHYAKKKKLLQHKTKIKSLHGSKIYIFQLNIEFFFYLFHTSSVIVNVICIYVKMNIYLMQLEHCYLCEKSNICVCSFILLLHWNL